MVALVLHILLYLFLTFVFDNSANDYISLMMFQQKKNDKSTFQTDICTYNDGTKQSFEMLIATICIF